MAAESVSDTTAEESTPDSASSAAEPRHLHPVPDDGPVPEDPPAPSAEDDNGTAGQPVEDTGDPEAAAESHPVGSSARSRVDVHAVLTWGRATFTPDSGMLSTRPLAVDEVLDRARRGSQLADAGPLRAVSTVHGYAAAGVKAGLRSIDWIVEHLARTAVGLVLLTALLIYPPTRMVLGHALAPAVWAHDLLT